MRKLLNLILALAVVFGLSAAAAAGQGLPPVSDRLQFFINQTLYLVNGEGRAMDVAPTIRESRALLPVRFAAEPLGSTVGWHEQEQKVTVTSGSRVIELWIGKSTARVNGAAIPIDPANPQVVPVIYRNRTMLPLRFVAENLDATVQWNPADSSITVVRGTGPEPPAPPSPKTGPAVITCFTANPGSISPGGAATLSWQVLNATAVTLDGTAAPATGTKTVLPAATTTYTLTATGATGSSSSTKTVIVTSPEGSGQPGSILLPANLSGLKLPLPGGGFTGSLQPLAPGNAESEPVALPGDFFSNLHLVGLPKAPVILNQPLYVRVYMDYLYCVGESDWDQGTTSDEPYLVVTGFNTYRSPKAWAVPAVRFDDVNSGSVCLITAGDKRLIFEGEVPSGATIGFNVLLWEADECDGATPIKIGNDTAAGIGSIIDSLTPEAGFAGDLASGIGEAIGGVLGNIFGSIECLSGAGGDDLVANETVTLKYDSLRQMVQGDAGRASVLDLNGGFAGHYNLRWHLEFDRQDNQSSPKKN